MAANDRCAVGGAHGPVLGTHFLWFVRFLCCVSRLTFVVSFASICLQGYVLQRKVSLRMNFTIDQSSRHPLLGGIILRDNIRACTPVLIVYHVS